MDNPIVRFIQQQGVLILDGGLATELEARGHVLNDALWSARLLIENPAAIQAVHEDYLFAGADCIISASYQATMPGFKGLGFNESEAETLLRRSADLALAARDRFWADPARPADRLRPLVAASIGPYGAYLADGSEYTGRYGLSGRALAEFHRRRWQILAATAVDLIAVETLPSWTELGAVVNLMRETPDRPVWVSFSCRDDGHISDGTPLADCVAFLNELPAVVAVGINCTAPRHLPGLITAARGVSDKPIVVYPNSGERYDAKTGGWYGEVDPADFSDAARAWYRRGARLLGGCCRTRPAHISRLRAAVLSGR